MSKEKRLFDPVEVTINDARAFVRKAQNKSGNRNLSLPTLSQLKVAAKSSEVLFLHNEWTNEGWVFNPRTGEVNKHPKGNVTASFRLVDNSNPGDFIQ